MTSTNIFKTILASQEKDKSQWTRCTYFRCGMNTGWAAGEDKYQCRAGLCVDTCGAVARPPKKIT